MAKKHWIIAGLLVFFAGAAWGTDYTWNGSVDDDWNEYGNWAAGASPATTGGLQSGDTLTIDVVGNDPSTNVPPNASDFDITALTMTAGTFTLPGGTIGAVTVDGGTLILAGNLTVTGAITVTAAGTLEAGANTVSADGDIIQSGGTITVAGGTLTSTGGDVNQSGGTISGADLTVNAQGGITLGGVNTAITGDVTLDTAGGSGSITFQSAFTPTGALTLTPGAGGVLVNGAVSLSAASISVTGTINGTAAGSDNLTLEATAGDITVSGAVGSGTALGDLTITGANDAAFDGNVTAASFTQAAGTGTTAFNGAQTYAGGFAFTGNGLTVNDAMTVGGTTTVTNGGNFTTGAAGAITSTGAFTQSGTGLTSLSGGITTADQDIVFNGPVELRGGITITSGSGGGDIELRDAVSKTANEDLTLDAGAGNVSLGTAGTASTQVVNDLDITAAALTINGDSGGIGAHVRPGGVMTVNGDTVNNGAITAGPAAAGSAAIVFNGDYTASGTGALTGFANTDIQFGGGVTLGPFTHNDGRTVFTGTASTISAAGTVTMGDVLVETGNTLTLDASLIIEQGNGKTLTLEASAVLDTSAGTWRMGTAGTLANSFAGYDGALTLGVNSKLKCADLHLLGVSSSNKFFVDNAAGPAVISASGDVTIQGVMATNDDFMIDIGSTYVSFTGKPPELVLEMTGNGKTLETGQPIGCLRITNTANVTLNATNVISGVPTLTLRGGLEIVYLSPAQGKFDAGSQNIVVFAGLDGTRDLAAHLPAGSDAVKYSRWEITNAPTPVPPFSSPMTAFVQNPGHSVTFKKESGSPLPVFFEVIGHTAWREFACNEAGAVIQFSRHPDQHVFTEKFSVKGTSGDPITLTRYDAAWPYGYSSSLGPPPSTPGPDPNGLPAYPPPADLKNAAAAEKEKYWNFSVDSGSGFDLDIEDLTVYFSHAYNRRVLIVDGAGIDALPFYRAGPPALGRFNYDWVKPPRRIIYSFTEDSDGNGRIDRIRAQAPLTLNGDFSGFRVRVHGYEVNTSEGHNGFQLVSAVTTQPGDEDSFYIYLHERLSPDGGDTPRWDVIENTSLRDAGGISLIGEPETDTGVVTFDTVPPRINYALTLPEHPETYTRFSEPVVPETPGTLPALSFAGTANFLSAEAVDITARKTYTHVYRDLQNNERRFSVDVDPGNLGYLLRLSAVCPVDELAALPPLYGGPTPGRSFMVSDMVDQAQRAMDWRDPAVDPQDYLYYPSPKYPLDWNYSEYAAVSGNGHLRGRGLANPDFSDDLPDAVKADGVTTVPIADVFLPPYKLLTTDMMSDLADGNPVSPAGFASPNAETRRVTDLLISRPPAGSGDDGYFVWPVWARHTIPANPAVQPGDEFWGQRASDTDVIWRFDGVKSLEERDITLQARLNGGLPGAGGVDLFFGFNVPARFRTPPSAPGRGGGSGGLWLPPPQSSDSPLFHAAPAFPAASRSMNLTSPELYNAAIFRTDPGFAGGARIDFLFKINGLSGADPNLFVARLDAPVGVVPPDWYRRVRPFSFDIQNVVTQRGGVTILNNVIKATTGENAYIRYRLNSAGPVTIQVFTLDGNLVKVIWRGFREAGEWTDTWDGRNSGGRPVARGMYFVRVVAPDIDEIRKIMVIK
ncbi:MAG: hypothetical protein LBG84_02200 [Treponema sp.]|jgi:hypothetical protein|nr:hypothetical protein [Treponema sp.]